MLDRRQILALPLLALARPALAADRADISRKVILTWHKLILELVRHTATYTPPVAARAFAYVGITAHEALASGNPGLRSLAGQVTDLSPLPARTGGVYDEPCVIHSALQAAVGELFFNTGPTGQRAMEAMGRKMGEMASDGVDSGTVDRSIAHGKAIAEHILAWSRVDGGAEIGNMGFPMEYTPGTRPQDWVPTNLIRLQQAPLLPD